MYNSAKHIRECIESVHNQTYENIEVICVDDGSTDETVDIINEYSKIDDRVLLIKQNKQYAGVARNNGIKAAHGEYLYFMDSDDFIENNLVELTLNTANENNADVVLFDGKKYDDKTKEYILVDHYLRKNLIPEKQVFNRKDIGQDFMMITSLSPWNKLFKKDFIIDNDIQFQPIQNTNDAFFVMSSITKASRISVVNERLINYRINNTSSIQGTKAKNPTCFLTAFDGIYQKLNEWGIYDEVEKGFIKIFLSCCKFSIESYRYNKTKLEVIKHISESDLYNNVIKSKNVDFYNDIPDYTYLLSSIMALDFKVINSLNDDIIVKDCNQTSPGISVIIPVYNVEKYLEECVNSVLNQIYHDIEIICVDDGSSDDSLSILNRLAENDNRIKIVKQTNAGLSAARNAGIKHSKGEYLLFLDSDDYLRSDALELIYKRVSEDNIDILYFDGISFSVNDEGEKEFFGDYYIRKKDYSSIYSGIELMSELEKNNEYRVSACMQVVKKDFLEQTGIRFIEGILHEDNIYTFQTLVRAEKASHLSEVLYYRRIHDDSITTMNYTFKHCYGYFKTYIMLLDEYKRLEDSGVEFDGCLYDIGYRVHSNSVDVYNKMDDIYKNIYYGLNSKEYYLFLELIYRLAERIDTLKKTYAEKSELNFKLQKTYKEKAERGIEINKLRNKLKSLGK